MSQGTMRRNLTAGSLRGHEDPRTVLLRMALDQGRAERIHQLKQQHPELTWREIADKIGVSERSALDWQATGGISHANCKKLAKVLGVDPDWLWSGVERGSPDLMGALQGDASQLDRIEAKLDLLLSRIPALGPAEVLEAEAARLRALREQTAAESKRKPRSRKAS